MTKEKITQKDKLEGIKKWKEIPNCKKTKALPEKKYCFQRVD